MYKKYVLLNILEKNQSPEQQLKAEDFLSTMYPEMIPTYLSFIGAD